MSEQDVAYAKINIIKNCLAAIEKVKSDIKDPFFMQGLFELNLQRAIQASIDLANVVIAKNGFSLPGSYKQSFEILSQNAILTDEQAIIMKKMVGFRNIAVLDYVVIKFEIVKSIVAKHREDFVRFYTAIYNHVQKWT